MPRILLVTLCFLAALPAAAHASVTTSVASGTLVVTGDNADDHIELTGTPGSVTVDGVPFDRGSFSSIIVRSGGGADEIVAGAGVSALIDGQSGTDTVLALGTDESEEFTLQSFIARARVSRDTDPGVIELAGSEVLAVSTGRGPDFVDVGDLSGTGVTRVDADLGLLDGPNDSLNVQGSDAADGIGASLIGERLRLTGLPVEVRVANGDKVTAFGFGGGDKLTALAPFPGLTFDGGEGNDDLSGPAILRGGNGDDKLKGGLAMSGDAGTDRLSVNGTGADDTVEIARSSVNGVPVDGIETIEATPGAGKDTVHVGDLTGSPITEVRANLGGLDSRLDTLAVDGTPGPDKLKVAPVGTNHAVTGLGYTVQMITTDPGQVISIDGGAGDDEIDASTMTKDKTQPFLFGGPGKDFLIGSPGQDVIDGGTELDVALLAGGLDTFTWKAGDGADLVEGGAGTDFLQMDGTAAADTFAVSPIGGRARVRANLETLDTGDLERIDLFPGRGADNLRVDDMSGTDVDHVDWTGSIARNSTVRDGSPDSVLINGSNGFDAISVTAAGPEVRETGLATQVVSRFNDPGLDRMHIDTRLGNDLVSVGATVAQQLIFTSS